ncbi:MAG TPA: outer membrane protein assembly factor BamA [Longimicrobiaceae bacterium]|nr:outer membrane protein assembly factor BamA [Longimicrobiaceae bacterium]
MRPVVTFVRGRAAAAALLAFALCALLPGAARAQEQAAEPAPSVVVDSVAVRGNARVRTPQIETWAGIRPGAAVTGLQVQAGLRRLMATGNFESVQMLFRERQPGRGVLVVEVVERPWVAQIEVRGLESANPRQTRDSVGLREGAPLDPQGIEDFKRLVADQLARRGVQLVGVDTSLTPLADPSLGYRLTLTVREGNRLAVSDVDFRGNQAFSDEDLVGAIRTKPEGFLWFRSGRFDREAFQTDLRENLPTFYGSHGYIDFRVLSDTLLVDPETGKARLVVEVSEGPQYRLGSFTVSGNSRFPTDELESLFTTQRRSVLGLPLGGESEREAGEVFDRAALDAATTQVVQLYHNEGYLYADVEPFIERVPAAEPGRSPTVNVTWAISERRPFYIRRISFEGNTNTHESVMRDRLWLLPGDVYNEERLIQSYQALSGLGFFETPMPHPGIEPDPEAGTVDITFHVTERNTGNISFGTVVGGGYGGRGGGFSGFLGYTEPNLFGQGKQANLRAEYGPGRSTLEASYTDPALFGTRNSGSVSIFRTGDRFIRTRNGRRIRTGASVQFGFPVPGFTRTRAFVGYSLARTAFEAIEDDCDASENVFCLPAATASTLSASLVRDTKNHPLFPTAGTRQSLSLEQTGGPLGGDGNFQKLLTQAEWWVPVGRLGSGPRPIRFAFGLQARAGSVFGDVSGFPLERFFVGGVLVGQPLRGYQEYTIGPRGYDLGCQSLTFDCLGDAFVTVTGEYAVRISDMLSVSAFMDAGNVYGNVREIDPTRLFRGAGLGVTLVTPFLGAIGIDAAYGFDRPDPGWELHFKLGAGF